MRILKARFRSTRDFLEAFQEDLPHGGLFCPTTRTMEKDEEVVVEVHFPDLPNKMMLRGTVIWWRSALPRLRVRAGALVSFPEEEYGKTEFILAAADGQITEAIKRRHPRIPVMVPVKWRPSDSTQLRESELLDISVGGALLVTGEHLVVDSEIILEVTIPGGAISMPIAAKVTHMGDLGAGVRFLYRDGGGSQRLREVVRRLVSAA